MKKRKKIKALKAILLLVVIYLFGNATFSLLNGTDTNIYNDDFIKAILADTNHNFLYKYKENKIINKAISFLTNFNVKSPNVKLGNVPANYVDETVVAADSDNYNPNELDKITDYIKDPNPKEITNPKVYIYNTHQLETYNDSNLEIYSIKPNVMMSAYLLKDKLNNLGVRTIVEESNITEFIRTNNWKHGDSYKASRIFILDAKNNNSTLEYFIDIHRDSALKKHTAVVINNKNYARTLFIVGLDNPNYQKNLDLATKLNTLINTKYPGLSRGIMKKQGKGVDGIYNQDIHPNAMLIEVGGVDNTIEDVLNTTNALSEILYEYIGD